MEYRSFFVVLAVIVAVHLLARWLRRATPAAQSPTPAAAAATTLEPAPPSLAAQLHELEGGFAPFGSNSAHPRELAEHPGFLAAADLLASPDVACETATQYALGANWALACAGLAALARRADGGTAAERVVGHFDRLAPWAMYFALDYFVRTTPRPAVGAPAVGAKDWWRENAFIPQFFQDYLVRRGALGDAAELGAGLNAAKAAPPETIRAFLASLSHPLAAALINTLDDIQRTRIDRDFLLSFGRFWERAGTDILIEPAPWHEAFAAVAAALARDPPRSLLVAGEPRCGKTAFLRLAARRATDWTVFEASAADLMAGQQWFGQLEGRIRRAIDELTIAKKLIWYIPDLLALARSGTHQGQSASILDQLLPALAAGRLVVWTEASVDAAARLLQVRPTLRGLIELVPLVSQTEEETQTLAHALIAEQAEHAVFAIDPGCVAVAVGTVRQYLGSSGFPGSVLQLLKLAVAAAEHDGHDVTAADILAALSQLTGLPVTMLDHKQRIDLAAIRDFFAQRVIGQDEAVTAIVERIAMLKAGLSDPDRPTGVFLFAGPTGTGKTELAKTTAEFLFGSAERLIRLDMSEYQSVDAISGILGGGVHSEAETLISRVRKQPFSVVLLDEFEKAHSRIWDLFLQVFDDGRLTDTLGQVADFRHCLIILTSNLGATSHQTGGFGFAAPPDVFTAEQVTRAITDAYRPELRNRIDRIIVFRPLTRELMRVILRKELQQVLERRGLKERTWAVEWEPSALELLLEKGFSPELGARPLKRAIEQYVIAPLAATIVEARFPEGDQFVFFRGNGHAIVAEFVDPDTGATSDASETAQGTGDVGGLPAMILAPQGTAAESAALSVQAAEVRQTLAATEWEDIKHRLAQEMSSTEFWRSPSRYRKLARLALMDRVAAAAETMEALRTRLARRADGERPYSRELVARAALQLHLVQQGIADVREDAPVEVALRIEPALESGGADERTTADWCRQLMDMYRGWSHRRHMQTSEIDGHPSLLLVAGFGAHRVLAGECGLHVLEPAADGAARAVARVRVVATPLGDIPTARLPGAVGKAFEEAPVPNAIVRRYRREPTPLVRGGDSRRRTGKLDAVLRGDFDLVAR